MATVEWAVFCKDAERDEGLSLTLHRVFLTTAAAELPMRMPIVLAVALSGRPFEPFSLTVTLVTPDGARHPAASSPVMAEMNFSGTWDVTLPIELPLSQLGEYQF